MADRVELLAQLALREKAVLAAQEHELRVRKEARALVERRREAVAETFEQVYLSVPCEHCKAEPGADCIGRPPGGWHTARYSICRLPEPR